MKLIIKTEKRKEEWNTMMPLIMAAAGETVVIRKISGKDNVRQHLADLGFVTDAAITVINQISGDLMVQVKGSRIALDRSMARRIFY